MKYMEVTMLVLRVNLFVLRLFINLYVLGAVVNLLFFHLFTSLFALVILVLVKLSVSVLARNLSVP